MQSLRRLMKRKGLKQKIGEKNADDVKKARAYMCRNYFDVRAFGAVMSTGEDPCGIVRGPVQINFARSISPVNIQDVTITRQARTTEDRKETGDTEIGRKEYYSICIVSCRRLCFSGSCK